MRPQGKSTENNLGKSRPSDDNDSTCQEIDEAKRALQAAYLWMKHRTNGLEERKYTESIIFCITGEGRIVGWTEAASLLVKKNGETLHNHNINDFMKLGDNGTWREAVSLVKPSFPGSVNVWLNDDLLQPVSRYTAKITSIILDKKRLFFLVLYPE
ncbi:MAG: hypothetical protein ACYC6Q_04680 [Syntrophales bacterium]